jgi:hypothetical protein
MTVERKIQTAVNDGAGVDPGEGAYVSESKPYAKPQIVARARVTSDPAGLPSPQKLVQHLRKTLAAELVNLNEETPEQTLRTMAKVLEDELSVVWAVLSKSRVIHDRRV